MNVDLFDFTLPERCIALRPASPRDHAKLLVVKAGQFADKVVRDLPDELRAGDVIVLNETKVLSAALSGARPARAHGGGGAAQIDVNLHKRVDSKTWRAFVRPAKRLQIGDRIDFSASLFACVTDKDEGDVALEFSLHGQALDAAIEAVGAPPLPPYIAKKRAPDAQDKQDYQTVFAQDMGSVAAPTAGLHFTQALLDQLTQRGIQIVTLTLHVGAGTFLPMKSDTTDGHVMHSEWRSISPKAAQTINDAKAKGGRIIAVGTTVLRALESAADRSEQGGGALRAQSGETDIFITPGFRFAIVDALMTNFHLPRSTLFMLVCALAGREVMQSAYRHAIDNDYRFYSYGDSSLLWKAGE